MYLYSQSPSSGTLSIWTSIAPSSFYIDHTLREESSQTNVILQYKLQAVILSAVCSVIQQS